jgi:hypothetical protein
MKSYGQKTFTLMKTKVEANTTDDAEEAKMISWSEQKPVSKPKVKLLPSKAVTKMLRKTQ